MSRRLVVALSGGIGGAKLALGLSRVLPADELLVVANTGDDFEHLGLSISPDIDTLIYTLAGINNPVTGWGRRDETWSFMESIGALGGEDWFRLGDRDLAMHVERTRRLRAGETLSQVTTDITRRLGIEHRILPIGREAREGRHHSRHEQRCGSTAQHGKPTLEVANAIGRRVRETIFDARDEVDATGSAVERLRDHTSRHSIQNSPVCCGKHGREASGRLDPPRLPS